MRLAEAHALRDRVVAAKKNDPDLTTSALAQRFGASRDQVRRWLREAGLPLADDRIRLSRSMHAGELKRALAKNRRTR